MKHKQTSQFDPHDFTYIKSVIDGILDDKTPLEVYNNEYQDIMGMYYMGLFGIEQTSSFLELLKHRDHLFYNLIHYYERCLKIDFNGNK